MVVRVVCRQRILWCAQVFQLPSPPLMGLCSELFLFPSFFSYCVYQYLCKRVWIVLAYVCIKLLGQFKPNIHISKKEREDEDEAEDEAEGMK